ncbi:MAG TPA: hypothetical protein VLL52_13285 [Anaerolineae bacterium]|nr:hypothetical protein [Anaerolineae bacterium]
MTSPHIYETRISQHYYQLISLIYPTAVFLMLWFIPPLYAFSWGQNALTTTIIFIIITLIWLGLRHLFFNPRRFLTYLTDQKISLTRFNKPIHPDIPLETITAVQLIYDKNNTLQRLIIAIPDQYILPPINDLDQFWLTLHPLLPSDVTITTQQNQFTFNYEQTTLSTHTLILFVAFSFIYLFNIPIIPTPYRYYLTLLFPIIGLPIWYRYRSKHIPIQKRKWLTVQLFVAIFILFELFSNPALKPICLPTHCDTYNFHQLTFLENDAIRAVRHFPRSRTAVIAHIPNHPFSWPRYRTIAMGQAGQVIVDVGMSANGRYTLALLEEASFDVTNPFTLTLYDWHTQTETNLANFDCSAYNLSQIRLLTTTNQLAIICNKPTRIDIRQLTMPQQTQHHITNLTAKPHTNNHITIAAHNLLLLTDQSQWHILDLDQQEIINTTPIPEQPLNHLRHATFVNPQSQSVHILNYNHIYHWNLTNNKLSPPCILANDIFNTYLTPNPIPTAFPLVINTIPSRSRYSTAIKISQLHPYPDCIAQPHNTIQLNQFMPHSHLTTTPNHLIITTQDDNKPFSVIFPRSTTKE